MSLPIKRDFQTALENIQETAKQAPNLYLKERSLDQARKLKNMALAAEARECAAYSGKLICMIEKDIADCNPPTPKQKTGRGHKRADSESALSIDSLSAIRRAYCGLSAEAAANRADAVIKEGGVPTRALFLSEYRTREKDRRIEAAKARKASAASKEKLKDFAMSCRAPAASATVGLWLSALSQSAWCAMTRGWSWTAPSHRLSGKSRAAPAKSL